MTRSKHTPSPGRRARSRRSPREANVRLVIADALAIDRGGMIRLLEDEQGFEVVGEAASVPEAISQCRALDPDVLVLSLNLPGQESEAAIPAIRAKLPRLKILALSERGAANCLVLNPPSRRRLKSELTPPCAVGMDCLQLAVGQGAMATLRRDADPEELFRAIRSAAEGIAWYDPTTANGLLTIVDRGRQAGTLSERETEVAALIAEGQSNKEISTALSISEATVKKHIGQLLQKLGVADRLQAGLLFARNPAMFRRPIAQR